ncbi:hypothetical protein CDV55_100628 [Aspergillus turcosus]|nr:hypothetical protein CDV55_100628 [Aspergillus turcosus]
MSSSRRPAGLPLAAGSSRKRRRDSSSPEHNLAQPQKRATADRRPSNNSDTASPRGHDQSSSSSPLKVLSRSPSPPSDDETAPPAPPALAPATAPATTAPAAAAAPLIPPGPGSVLLGAESKQIAYMILKMFNPTAVELINGADIDRPVNALSMTIELHRLFGNFKIAFEQIGPPGSHMYKVDYVKPGHRVRVEKLPVTVSLPLPPERNIDPTSPELLAIHSAIGRILHLSAVGEYIDKFFRDMEELEGGEIMANGSTRIEDYVLFRLAGTEWLDETSVVEQHWRNATPVTDRGESMPAM